MYFVHLGTVNKSIKNLSETQINELLESGWELGKCPSHWITNGKDNKLLKEGENMPPGYSYGQSEEFKSKNSVGNINRWKNMSQSDKEKMSKKISATLTSMWSTMPQETRQSREYRRQLTNSHWTDQQKLEIHNKMSESAIKDRKGRTSERNREIFEKGLRTRMLKGNIHISKYEEDMNNTLLQTFQQEDVIREYKCDRYPFHCDFYVKPLDLFIELNMHWTHGKHPYNAESDEDKIELQRIHTKENENPNCTVNTYFTYEDVWTNKDVEKLRVARMNNLKYIVIYTDEEFEQLKDKILRGEAL